MKKLVVVCLLSGGPVALAEPAEPNNEAWIPLEDLSADDQEDILDAADGDGPKGHAVPEWAEVTDQLVRHALFQKALLETGADLLPGIR